MSNCCFSEEKTFLTLLIIHNCIYINYIIPSSQDREREGFTRAVQVDGLQTRRALSYFYTMTAHCGKDVSLQPQGKTGEFLTEVN